MRRRLRRIPWLAAIGGLATGVALVLSVSLLLSTNDLAARNCQQIQQVYGRIQTVVIQGSKTLGQPGSPGYDYYAAHPAELAQAQHANAQAIRAFEPQPCP